MTAAPMVRMESLSWLRLCDSQPQELLSWLDVIQGARHLVLKVFINLPPGLLPETFSTVTVFQVFFHSFFYSSSSSSRIFLSFSTASITLLQWQTDVSRDTFSLPVFPSSRCPGEYIQVGSVADD